MYFQLKTLGRVALRENGEYGYSFFYHIALCMESLTSVAEAKKSEEARDLVITSILRDEKKFSRVSKNIVLPK